MTGTPQAAGVYDVTYTGSSKMTGPELAGSGLNNVTVNLTSGETLALDQTRLPDGNLSVNVGTFDLGFFTFNNGDGSGTLTVANGATLRIGGTGTLPSSYTTYTINANPTSTVEYYGTAQTVGNITYGNLTLSGSGTKTLQTGTTALSGNLTLSGTASATLVVNVAISGDLNIGGGTLALSTFTANRAAAGGTLTVASGALLRIGGTSTLPSNYSTHAIDAASTVEYYGTAQTVQNPSSSQTYGNLTLSTSGIKTLQAGMTAISGNLTLSGTATATTVANLTIGGNLSVGSGTTLTAANNLGVTGTTTVGGTLTLSGANTFAGGVALSSGGLLNLNSATALNGYTLTINGGTINTSIGGPFTLSPASQMNWNGDFAFTGTSSLNLGSGAVTLNANRIVTVSANTLTVDGVIGGAFTVTKAGTGTLELTGANTFSGQLTIQNGTLKVPTVNDAGAAGPLGQSANAVVLGAGSSTAGTLQYTGGTTASTKPFNIDFGGVAQIDNAGTVLTLSGLVQQTGSGKLTKTGSGTLILAGADDNFGLGATNSVGTLVLAKSSTADVHCIGGGGLTISGGTVQLGGTGGDQIYDFGTVTVNSGTFDFNGRNEALTVLNGSGGTILNNGGGASTLTIGVAGNATGGGSYAGVIANNTSGGGTLALVKTGTGTQTLSGNNTYTGGTTVNEGALTLSYTAAASRLADTGVLTLSGGAVNLTGGSSHTEIVGSTTINQGASSVTGTAGARVLRQNVITRNIGGTVNYGAASIADADGTITVNSVVPWATLNATDWATKTSAGDAAITAYSGYTTTLPASGNNSTVNYSLTGSDTVTGDLQVNSLKLTTSAANQSLAISAGVTLTLSGNGLLFVGANNYTISGGNITAGNGAGAYEVIIHQNGAGILTNGAAIQDNGANATALTKSGTGKLILSGTNTYSGNTFVNAGTLELRNVGSGLNNSARLILSGSAIVTNGFSGTDTIGGLSFDGGATWQARGTWGATGSGATNINDTHFKGTGKLNVSPSITVTAQTNTKTYDGDTTSATLPMYTGTLSAGDTITLTQTYDNQNAGTGKTLTPAATIKDSGDNDVTANYTVIYVNSSAGVITQASTSIAVSSSINPSGFTTNVTFTATLPAATTGSVTFKTNGVALTNAPLSGGTATAATTLLPRGTNTITAEYAGDGNYLGSTNDLAGGQVVTNRPPVAGNATYTRATGSGLFINIANLLTNVTQRAADHVITLTSVGSGSQGATIAINGASIRYSPLPAHNANDSFTYTVSDGQGGTATGNVAVNNRSSTGQVSGEVTVTTNSVTSRFAAVPGWTYYVQRSTNLSAGVGWISINTNLVPSSGLITNVDNFTDLGAPPASAYYRLFLQ